MNDFDKHWDEHFSREIPLTKKRQAEKFLGPMLSSKKDGGLLILDAGCGDGVHAEVFAEHGLLQGGANLVALDISSSSLKIVRSRGNGVWAFVQGDVGRLPFGSGLFDAVFSFGVLAYTDNPSESFTELCRVLKPGGTVGVWVYPKRQGVMGMLFSMVRLFCQIAGPKGARMMAHCIVPFLPILPTSSKISLSNATWSQCREIVEVNIMPAQLEFPTEAEVKQWFFENHIKVVDSDETEPITLWGVKI